MRILSAVIVVNVSRGQQGSRRPGFVRDAFTQIRVTGIESQGKLGMIELAAAGRPGRPSGCRDAHPAAYFRHRSRRRRRGRGHQGARALAPAPIGVAPVRFHRTGRRDGRPGRLRRQPPASRRSAPGRRSIPGGCSGRSNPGRHARRGSSAHPSSHGRCGPQAPDSAPDQRARPDRGDRSSRAGSRAPLRPRLLANSSSSSRTDCAVAVGDHGAEEAVGQILVGMELKWLNHRHCSSHGHKWLVEVANAGHHSRRATTDNRHLEWRSRRDRSMGRQARISDSQQSHRPQSRVCLPPILYSLGRK